MGKHTVGLWPTPILACSLWSTHAWAQQCAPDSAAPAPPSAAQEAQGPTVAPPDGAPSKQSAEADAAKQLSTAAASLEKSSKALADAASKLPEKKEEEKKLVDGTVGFGERSGWNGLLLTFKEKEKKATGQASVTTLGGALSVGMSLTAPLDSETRLAAFTDNHVRALPFEAGLRIEYNRMSDYLASWLGRSYERIADVCNEFRAHWQASQPPGPKKRTPACPESDDFRQWTKEREREAAAPARFDSVDEKPVPLGVLWTLGGEGKVSFDRQDVYVDDLAAKAKSFSATRIQANAVLRIYPLSWLAVPVRVGVDYEDTFKANTVKRCRSLPSTDTTITGQACEDKLFLKSNPDGETRGTAEVALVTVIPGVTQALAVGAEIRDHVDALGPARLNTLSLAAFASPTSKPILMRFGLGVGWSHAIDDDMDSDVAKGDNWLTPFLLAGGSL